MRRITFVLLAAVFAAGCYGRTTAPNPAAVDGSAEPAAAPAAAAPAPAPAEPAAPVSPNAALRDGIAKWVKAVEYCDKAWFAKVDPDKLDNWELPVDVSSMEDDCGHIITEFQELSRDNLFKGRALDGLVRRMATVTDLYTHLAFRCRRIGVRERLPYKKMLVSLRDTLRAEVAALGTDAGTVLALDDAKLIEAASVTGQDLVSWADGNLARVGSDLETWVIKPRKEVGPIMKYSLGVSGALAVKSAAALASSGAAADAKLQEAATVLAHAYEVVTGFFTGDYLAEEEAKAPALYKSVARAFAAYQKVAARLAGR